MKYKQIAVIEYHTGDLFVYQLESKEPITMERVADHFSEIEDWDEERDSITFIDSIETYSLD